MDVEQDRTQTVVKSDQGHDRAIIPSQYKDEGNPESTRRKKTRQKIPQPAENTSEGKNRSGTKQKITRGESYYAPASEFRESK